jgi:hypothetical protein
MQAERDRKGRDIPMKTGKDVRGHDREDATRRARPQDARRRSH